MAALMAIQRGPRWALLGVIAIMLLLTTQAAASTGRSLTGLWDDVGCACDTDSSVSLPWLTFGSSGFCRIARAVKPGLGLACRCHFSAFKGCYGTTEKCLDPNSPACKQPSTNLESCLQGNGNCRGYVNEACSCGRSGQGCVLVKAPPANTTCKCKAKMTVKNVSFGDLAKGTTDAGVSWSCMGFPVPCADSNSPFCKNPDLSEDTCKEGLRSKGDGGICSADPEYIDNCDGYRK